MEKKLDSILELLNKAKNTNDLKQLDFIEEELQKLKSSLEEDIKKHDSSSDKIDIEKQLEKLKYIIETLDSNKIFNNKLLNEFQQFVQNRKFK